MVNITNRMHRLMPDLWRVKGGAGAAILPPRPPAPQLTNVVLRLPNPSGGYDFGAHTFWRKFLPALRYHNLTLPIKVEQTLNATVDIAPTLTLEFEATTSDALEKQKAQPTYTDQQSLSNWRDALREKRATAKEAETEGGSIAKQNPNSRVNQLRRQQEEVGIPPKFATNLGSVSLKPQPPADPAAPSTTSPPVTMYQRTMTLGLRGRDARQIWHWFQTVTRARPYKMKRQERTDQARYKRQAKRGEKDRQRVRAGLDEVKREREELKKAREAAERLAQA